MVDKVYSLATLAGKQIAKDLCTNECNISDFEKLYIDERNDVFRHVVAFAKDPNVLLGEKMVENIGKLRASKADIVGPGLHIAESVRAQSIRELTLRDFVNLNEALTALINEDRHCLTVLNIYGGALNGWPEAQKYLWSVEELLINRTPLLSLSVRPFLYSLTNLKRLNLSHTYMTSLSGISNLVQLEKLVIKEALFTRKENILELFALQKLRWLDLGELVPEEAMSDNVKLYIECQKSLPELTYMGCVGNRISQADLEYLVDSHPKLATISLLWTPVESTAEIERPSRRIRLVAVQNIITCLEAYEFHIQNGDYHYVFSLVRPKLQYLLENSFSKLSIAEKQRCFDLMLKMMNKFNEPGDCDYSTSLLMFRCALVSLNLMLVGSYVPQTELDKEMVIAAVLKGLRMLDVNNLDGNSELYTSWWILQNKAIMETPKFYGILCEKAAATIYQCATHVSDDSKFVVQACYQILIMLLHKIDPRQAFDLVKDHRLISHLYQACVADDTYNERLTETASVFTHRVSSTVSSVASNKSSRDVWPQMITCSIERAQNSPEYGYNLALMAVWYTLPFVDQHVLKYAVRSGLNKNFWSVFYPNTLVQPPAIQHLSNDAAISLLVQWVDCLKRIGTSDENDPMQLDCEKVLKVKKALKSYRPGKFAEYLDVIVWLQHNSTCEEVKEWAGEVLDAMREEKGTRKRPGESSDALEPDNKKRSQ